MLNESKIRVVIIDDESEILKGIVNLINWEKLGFELALVTTSPNKVISFNEKFDLLITDISMPQMDGFELIKNMKKKNIHLKSLFITCHKSFNYAREAIILGVEDYIVKYTINSEELTSILLNIKHKIVKENLTIKQLSQFNRIEETSNFQLILREYFEVENNLEKLKINLLNNQQFILSSSYYGSMTLYLLIGQDNKSTLYQSGFKYMVVKILDIINNIIGDEIEFLPYFSKEYSLNFFFSNKISEKSFLLLLQKISLNIRKILNINILICYSLNLFSINNLKEVFEKMQQYNKLFFYKSSSYIKHVDFTEIKGISNSFVIDFNSFSTKFILNLNNLNFCKQQELSNQFFDYCLKNKIDSDLVLNFLYKLISVINTNFDLSYNLVNTSTFDDVKNEFNETLKDFYNNQRMVIEENYSDAIIKSISYIDNHPNDKISCKILSNYVNLDRSYFSRLFKSQTGQNISVYIQDKKVAHAKMLLQYSNLTVEEIAYKVGFTSTQNFCRLIKKKTGLTPLQVKNNI